LKQQDQRPYESLTRQSGATDRRSSEYSRERSFVGGEIATGPDNPPNEDVRSSQTGFSRIRCDEKGPLNCRFIADSVGTGLTPVGERLLIFGTCGTSDNDRTACNQNKSTTKSAEDFIFFSGCDSRLPKHRDLIIRTLTISIFELP
jgi:hypothetical protein